MVQSRSGSRKSVLDNFQLGINILSKFAFLQNFVPEFIVGLPAKAFFKQYFLNVLLLTYKTRACLMKLFLFSVVIS